MRFLNRAQESFTTTGTGTLTLGGAPTGWRTFAAALNADLGLSGTVTVVGYFAVSADEATWEFGYGTVDTAAGTITRNLIASSTGSAINWPAGTKYIFSTPEAIHFTKMFELHRGSTAPATARAGTPWLDTNAGVTDVRFKIYDGADWNALFSIDETNNRVYPLDLTGAKIGGAQVDLASATTPALGGTASDRVRITGTTTITGFGTVADGVRRFVRFAGALTLTYHATSLILPGSANITTAADDEALFVSLGSGNWKCLYFTRRDGTALVASGNPAHGMALTNGKLAFSVAGSALTVAVKTLAGADPSAGDPVKVAIPDGAGGVNVRSITSALSLVISNGSTLGTANSTPFRIRIGALDNGGTVELFAYNTVSGTTIKAPGEYETVSTTAEGGAGGADAAQTAYSATSRSTKQFRWIGFADWNSGLATAGAWSAGPSVAYLQGVGQPLPGEEVGHANTSAGAVATGTTTMPQDDSIPQNTEGDQYMTITYPRRSPVNLLEIEHIGYYSQSAGTYLVSALFQDATAGALAAGMRYNPSNANVHAPTPLKHRRLCGAAGNTTFNVRAGASSAATVTFNGISGGRMLGGVMASTLGVRELAA